MCPLAVLGDGPPAPAAPIAADFFGRHPDPAGRAHVVLDPASARLKPGEVFVAPSTDPGWTPLFMTAGALVMEMAGMMSHGWIVAREYGIPAVVGVPGATGAIRTGHLVTVHGGMGVVRLVAEDR